MQNRSLASNLGIYACAAGAIFLGLLGLVSGDFATTWQRVGSSVPFREPLANFTAFIELAAGLALLWPRTARAGALTLTVVYSAFTLLWVPKILEVLTGRRAHLAPRVPLRPSLRPFRNLFRHRPHLRYARPRGLGPSMDSAFTDVLVLRYDHRLFPRRRSHPFGHHGSARLASAHR